ncbi:MAG: hypothetical protein RL348_97, partial [Bacteroidota bacterium]
MFDNINKFLQSRLDWKHVLISSALIVFMLIAILTIVDTFVMPNYVHSVKEVTVPNFVGKSISTAKLLLQHSGLSIAEVREVYSDKIAKGNIISQLPFSGSHVREGRRLYLTVSKGIEKIEVPFLTGKTERDARLQLMSMGFQVGDITFVENDEIPRGLVINQFVPPGSKLPYGYSIGFQVSLGNSEIIVPLLTGYTLDEARGILFDIGLYLHLIEYIPGDG